MGANADAGKLKFGSWITLPVKSFVGMHAAKASHPARFLATGT